jgi:hypothetical protein
MKTKTQKIYIAEDGKEFIDKVECEKHDSKLKEEEKTVTFWQIVNQPDLTEGRGHYGLIYVKVKVGEYDSPLIFLQDYCVRTFGRPIAFVQGCSPMTNWIITQSDKFKYYAGGKISVGDYSYPSKSLDLVLGPGESGLIEKT